MQCFSYYIVTYANINTYTLVICFFTYFREQIYDKFLLLVSCSIDFYKDIEKCVYRYNYKKTKKIVCILRASGNDRSNSPCLLINQSQVIFDWKNKKNN